MEKRDIEQRVTNPLKVIEEIGPYTFTMEIGATGAQYHIAIDVLADGKVTKVGDAVKREVYLDALATVRTSTLEGLRNSLCEDANCENPIVKALDKIADNLDPGIEDSFAADLRRAILLAAE